MSNARPTANFPIEQPTTDVSLIDGIQEILEGSQLRAANDLESRSDDTWIHLVQDRIWNEYSDDILDEREKVWLEAISLIDGLPLQKAYSTKQRNTWTPSDKVVGVWDFVRLDHNDDTTVEVTSSFSLSVGVGTESSEDRIHFTNWSQPQEAVKLLEATTSSVPAKRASYQQVLGVKPQREGLHRVMSIDKIRSALGTFLINNSAFIEAEVRAKPLGYEDEFGSQLGSRVIKSLIAKADHDPLIRDESFINYSGRQLRLDRSLSLTQLAEHLRGLLGWQVGQPYINMQQIIDLAHTSTPKGH